MKLRDQLKLEVGGVYKLSISKENRESEKRTHLLPCSFRDLIHSFFKMRLQVLVKV